MDLFNPAVTVVVPIYNVERYIEKCARSLFEQSLANLEILFVNDCTPDNSIDIILKVLADYPQRKEQTRIIKMSSNSGLAAVRRQGIIEAKGEFIIHCDGDDWADRTLYERMYNTAVRNNSDIVICDLIEDYTNHSIRHKQEPLFSNSRDVLRNWYHSILHMSCCNKLVRRSIYCDNNILPWIGLNMWEDNGLTTRLFYHASKISYISDAAYHYNRTNVNAMTSGYGIKQVEQMIAVASNLEKFFKEKTDYVDYERTIDAFKFYARINLITDSFNNYRRFKNTFPESRYIMSELDTNGFSSKGKIRFFMVKYGLAPLFIASFKIKNLLFK